MSGDAEIVPVEGEVTLGSRTFTMTGRVLGRGHSAIVQECVAQDNGQHSAMKVVDKTRMSKHAVVRVLNEVELTRSLFHPNIVQVFDYADTADKLFFNMELAAGGELFEKLMEMEQFTEFQAQRIIYKVMMAVRYLHDKDIVHRDLKPENLLLSTPEVEEAEVKLADFGMAKILTHDQMASTPCGSMGYAAPEVLEEDGLYDKACDLWSVGIITYVLLSGMFPFSDDDYDNEVFELVFPAECWGSISMSAKDFVSRLLVVDPAERPAARAVLDHPWMQQMSAHLAAADAASGGEPLLPPPSPTINFTTRVRQSTGSMSERFAAANEFARNLTPTSPALQRRRSNSQSMSPMMPLAGRLEPGGESVPELALDGSSTLMNRRKA